METHSNGDLPDNRRPPAHKRINNTTLILAAFTAGLVGLLMIVIGMQSGSSRWHEGLVGVGAAILATGPVTILVWKVTDAIYSETLESYRDEVASTILRAVNPALDRTTGAVVEYLRSKFGLLEQLDQLNIENVYRTREEALGYYAHEVEAEIDRAHTGEDARLWFVSTDMRGFIGASTLDAEALLRRAANEKTLDLRILMADPESRAREASGETRAAEIHNESNQVAAQLVGACHVPSTAIRYSRSAPTMFAIATKEYMLLNPYPNTDKPHRFLTLLIRRRGTGSNPMSDQGDVYGQYLHTHFESTWDAAAGTAGAQAKDGTSRGTGSVDADDNPVSYSIKGSPATIGIVTGDILNVVDVDTWVNSENTYMEMSRYFESTVSAAIRYRGATLDPAGNVLEDVIANDLRRGMAGAVSVPAGHVMETTPGGLRSSNGVRRLLHVASVQATPGRGFRQIDDVAMCVHRVLERASKPSADGEVSTSVLFPLLGVGHGRGSVGQTATPMCRAAADFLRDHPESSVRAVFVLAYTREEQEAVREALAGLSDVAPV